MKKRIIVPLFFMLVLLISMSLNAFAGVTHSNEWNGTTYDTPEGLQELEGIIREEGFICVSAGRSDNEEYTTFLADFKPFWNYYNIGMAEAGYLVFVLPDKVEGAKTNNIDKINDLNENGTVILDYYTIDAVTRMEEGTITGKTGSDIGENVPTGTISIQGLMHDDILNNYPTAVASVILLGNEHMERFQLDLTPENEYTIVTSIPIDRYTIESAFIDEAYPPSYAEVLKKGFRITEGGAISFDIGFGVEASATNVKTAEEMEGVEISETPKTDPVDLSSEKPSESISVKPQEDITVSEPVIIEQDNSPKTAVYILIGVGASFVLLIVVAIIIIFSIRKKNKNEE